MEKGKKNCKTPNRQHLSTKKFRTLPQSNALGKEKSHNTTTQQHSGKEKKNCKTPNRQHLSPKKNSEPYRNPILWARKNLTQLLHNNIHYFSKSNSIELIWPNQNFFFLDISNKISLNATKTNKYRQGLSPISQVPTDNNNQNMLVGKGLILKEVIFHSFFLKRKSSQFLTNSNIQCTEKNYQQITSI